MEIWADDLFPHYSPQRLEEALLGEEGGRQDHIRVMMLILGFNLGIEPSQPYMHSKQLLHCTSLLAPNSFCFTPKLKQKLPPYQEDIEPSTLLGQGLLRVFAGSLLWRAENK